MAFLFGVLLIVCCIVPGFTMLFFPDKAFVTATKPRWLGVPFLGVGLLVLCGFWRVLAMLLGINLRN